MKMPLNILRSKVAHRVVLLFVSCALLPTVILAALAYFQVSSQLNAQSEKQLKNASKAQGMEILERLEILDSDLAWLGSKFAEHRSLPTADVSRHHFKDVRVVAPGQRADDQTPQNDSALQLGPAERDHLISGKPLLRLGKCTRASDDCVLLMRLARSGADRFLLVGEVNPDYLWDVKNQWDDLPFCVASSRGIAFCSDNRFSASATDERSFKGAYGSYQWQLGASPYRAAYWKVLLRPVYLEDSWTVVVSQERADVFAPLLQFRKIFPLIVLFSVLVVLFLSMVQVRRTLVPLEELREGTQRVLGGEFENPVRVASGDEFQDLATSFNSMATQLGRQFHTLETINAIGGAIFASLDREAIVDGVLSHLPRLLPCERFAVCFFDDRCSGGWTRFRDADSDRIHRGEFSIANSDWVELQINSAALHITDNGEVPGYLAPLAEGGMRSFVVFPIRVENAIQAALVCVQKGPSTLTSGDLAEARRVADQLAVAFSHVRLIGELKQLHWGTLTALARAIDAKSKWTSGHSERVTELGLKIGRKMGLSSRDQQIMQMGGLLHDIGKIGTPPEILDKPGKLAPTEMEMMKDHVRTGVRILEPIGPFREALSIVGQHHEWFNGAGYPTGVAGKDISLYARIIAVADCFDALTSDRPYRKGWSGDQAMGHLIKKSGEQFDPDVLDAFTKVMADESGEKSSTAENKVTYS